MIAFDRVGMSYPGTEAAAVRDVSLEIVRGTFFVLIGESGSGKTTTLHLINRLIEPDVGKIRIDGVDAPAARPGRNCGAGWASSFRPSGCSPI